MATQRWEFASPEWLSAMERTIRDLVEAAGPAGRTARWSLSETYTDPPAHLLPATGELGWHVRLEDGRVGFATTPSPSCGAVVAVDYASVLPLARAVSGDEAARELRGDLVARGVLRIEPVAPPAPPTFLAPLHDLMAAVTA